MAKKKRKGKPPKARSWRAGMTTDEALDHLRHDSWAKFDNLNRIVLPLGDRIRILTQIAKLISAFAAKDDLL